MRVVAIGDSLEYIVDQPLCMQRRPQFKRHSEAFMLALELRPAVLAPAVVAHVTRLRHPYAFFCSRPPNFVDTRVVCIS